MLSGFDVDSFTGYFLRGAKMLSLSETYIKQAIKREELIRKLFEDIARKTIGLENIHKVRLTILYSSHFGCNWCECQGNDSIKIGIELPAIKKRVAKGYEDCYYSDRKLKTDKYILHNRHNAIRFALYHELKHAKDFIEHKYEEREREEFEADEWAVKHLEGVK